jgi:hypothetical protein
LEPLAYHITFSAYGTWLHGTNRGSVQSGVPGIQPPDQDRERQARERMVAESVTFTEDQRRIIEQTIRDHCRIRCWMLHAVNARNTHIHVVVTADRHPDEVMDQFKAWCSRKRSDAAGLTEPLAKKAGRRKWFTEHGSTKWIDTEQYLAEAVHYVLECQ